MKIHQKHETRIQTGFVCREAETMAKGCVTVWTRTADVEGTCDDCTITETSLCQGLNSGKSTATPMSRVCYRSKHFKIIFILMSEKLASTKLSGRRGPVLGSKGRAKHVLSVLPPSYSLLESPQKLV